MIDQSAIYQNQQDPNKMKQRKGDSLILTFILVKSITWNIEGAINNLGSKASTTGFMEEMKWVDPISDIIIFINRPNLWQ